MKITLELTWRHVLRWLIGLLLVWAALGKLANLQAFLTVLLAYRLPLPAVVLKLVAIVLPWLELLCGLLLLAKPKPQAALTWALLLFTVFAICTGEAWARGLQIGCGCLDLSLLGIRRGSAAAAFFESPAFAFGRALVLVGIAFGLLRQREKPADIPSRI